MNDWICVWFVPPVSCTVFCLSALFNVQPEQHQQSGLGNGKLTPECTPQWAVFLCRWPKQHHVSSPYRTILLGGLYVVFSESKRLPLILQVCTQYSATFGAHYIVLCGNKRVGYDTVRSLWSGTMPMQYWLTRLFIQVQNVLSWCVLVSHYAVLNYDKHVWVWDIFVSR